LFPLPFSLFFLPWLAHNYSNPSVSLFLYLYIVFIWIMIRSVGTVQCLRGFFQEVAENISFVGRFVLSLATRYVYEYSYDPENTHVHIHIHAMQLYPFRTHPGNISKLIMPRSPQPQRTGGWSADIRKRKGMRLQNKQSFSFNRDQSLIR